MKNYPVTVVDDFLENPTLIRDWANTLEYYRDTEVGAWPGERSDQISSINKELYHTLSTKLISLFYDMSTSDFHYEDIEMEFQRTSPYFPGPEQHPLDKGWIHEDDTLFSGVIYLNKDFPSGTGTSIYDKKPGYQHVSQDMKFPFYRGEEVDMTEYANNLIENNGQYIESIRVENKFNRLILFEGGVPHGVPSFWQDTNEPRITLVFFVKNFTINKPSPSVRANTTTTKYLG